MCKMIEPWWWPAIDFDRQTFAADMFFNGAAEGEFPPQDACGRLVRLQGM